jgi:hypothetical protein
LHEVPEHLAIVDDPIENLLQDRPTLVTAGGEHRAEQSRSVLHVAAFTGLESQLTEELRIDLLGEVQDLIELRLRIRVERVAEEAGHDQLRQCLTVLALVSLATGLIDRGCLLRLERSLLGGLLRTTEKCLARHKRTSI